MDNEPGINKQDSARELITSGHVWRAVWYLAWPTALNTFFMTAYNLINRWFIGHIHGNVADAAAALGIGGGILMVQFALTLGLSIGTSALVSRFIGARQDQDAVEATRQSIILAVIVGILSSIPLMIWAEPLVRAAGAKPAVVPLGADFLTIVAASSVASFLFMVITSALRSIGDMKTPLYAGMINIAVNIIFDWILITGVSPMHRTGVIGVTVSAVVCWVARMVVYFGLPVHGMGVHGAAISTVISRIAGLIACVAYLERSILAASLHNLRAKAEWFGRILAIGVPAMAQQFLWTSAYMGFIRVLGDLPGATTAQAALTFGIAIESTCFMPGVAYSMAATPLVGQNLGAGKPDRAEHSAWVATWQAVAIMALVAVFFVAVPRQLALLFTQDPAIVPLTASYLMINAISEPFLALGMVLRGALQGAGDVTVPAGIAALTLWVIRMPLAWLLAIHLKLGVDGAWWAMSISTILSGLLTVVWFKVGVWRKTQV